MLMLTKGLLLVFSLIGLSNFHTSLTSEFTEIKAIQEILVETKRLIRSIHIKLIDTAIVLKIKR